MLIAGPIRHALPSILVTWAILSGINKRQEKSTTKSALYYLKETFQ